MESKRIEKLVALLLVGILMPVSLFPFPIHAETIDTHIRGRNYTYEPITYNEIQVSTNTYYENIGVIHITFELDDEYIGYVLPNYTIQYDNYFYGSSTPNWGTLSKTFDRRIFINGSSFSFDVTVNWNSISINNAPGGDPFNYDSYTITSSDVTKYADIDSLDQIINILQDLYNSNDQIEGLLNDQLSQLQLIVSNTSLANTYLETISKLRKYNVPIESLTLNLYAIDRYDLDMNNIYLNYPVFYGKNIILSNRYMSTTQYMLYIMGVNAEISEITFGNYFKEYTDKADFYDFQIISISNDYTIFKIKAKFKPNQSAGRMQFVPYNTSAKYLFIFANRSDQVSNISTEFALQYGLSNSMLDNIQKIANGTSQSQSASGSLDQTTSQFSDDANDLVTIEESFNNSMNQSLQSVNPTFNMGSSFLTSANWVSQQFNRIVNNTPFASLITFGLTLGLGLLIIGKVRK